MISPVKNQKRCNSCYAFSVVAIIEAAYKMKYGGDFLNLAEQEILDCDTKNYDCRGGQPSFALEYIINNFIGYTKDYPYIAKKNICKILKD